MHPELENQSQSTKIPSAAKPSLWRKLGGGPLTISLFLHAVLLAVAVIWVLGIIPTDPEKVVTFAPKSGQSISSRPTAARFLPPGPSRRTICPVSSTVNLPESESLTTMTSLGSLGSAGLSARDTGLGISGTNAGTGDWGIMSDGTGSKSPFGMIEMNAGGLAGSFYDLKQTRNLKPTGLSDSGVREALKDIVQRGLKERDLANYFKAPVTLYQTQFMIPRMSADLAPAAFEVEDHVQPKRWAVVYRGAVKAPRSGRFRFVGAGDDVLLVRFNNWLVFDHGYTLACTGGGAGASKEVTSREAREFKRLSPMPVPTVRYQYSTTPTINKALGGFAIGPEFKVNANETYPIEILISEIPGGLFSTALMIEEPGVIYQKDAGGSPILPLFRLDRSQSHAGPQGESPPVDPDGLIWKSATAVEGF